MDDPVRQIRERIIRIVIRAFLLVTLIILLLTFIATAFFVSNNLEPTSLTQIPIFLKLEGYYIGHGSWDGVEILFPSDEKNTLADTVAYLLDANDVIVIDHQVNSEKQVGEKYVRQPHDIVIDINHKGVKVGALVVNRLNSSARSLLMTRVMVPIGLITLFLILPAVMVGVLVTRRVAAPLAEVIAAARAVTDGKLDTRVNVQGPIDLRALIDSFNQMAASLERNDRERRAMLADIAHELRTPISIIRGRLEGILDGVYPADENHISLALKSNYMLEHLVEDLRLLTLAESRQLHFERKEIDLASIARHTLDMLEVEAQEKNIHLELSCAPGEFQVSIDPQRTEQVIANLVENALRYTPQGGRIWLELGRIGSQVTLSVNDDGPGIPEEDLPYIFNRFWRKDKSRSRETGGSGLGLAISKQLIEAQGGQITAQNLNGGGFQVKIILSQ